MGAKSLAFLAANPVAPIDGATISMIERLGSLRDHYGWEVQILCTARSENREGLLRTLSGFGFRPHDEGGVIRYRIRGIEVSAAIGPSLDRFDERNLENVRAALGHLIEEKKPNVRLSNFRDLPSTSLAIEAPHAVFLTENEYLRPVQVKASSNASVYERTYQGIRLCVVASSFLKESVREGWGIDAVRLTNPVDLDSLIALREETQRGNHITTLHPLPHKGVDVFLSIVSALPERQFLLAGAFGSHYRRSASRFSQYANLLHVPFQSDVRAVYCRSRTVLVPSLWQEAFSRVVVEACAAGIPVIASKVGGVEEAGEDAAVYVPVKPMTVGSEPPLQDITPWIDALVRLDDPGVFANARERCIGRTERYKKSLEEDLSRLNGMLEEAVHT